MQNATHVQDASHFLSLMNELILVKHSLPEIKPNVLAREWHLSTEGRARSEALAAELAGYSPVVIFSSVEPKAVETAQIVAARLGVPFQTAEGLHEHERSREVFTDVARFENALAEFFARPRELVYGDETADAAHERFSRAVQAVVAAHSDKNIVIVAHGTVIALFVARAARVEPFAFWKQLGLPAYVILSGPNLALEKICQEIPRTRPENSKQR